jgi:serine/threonine protein kinase
VLLYIFVCGHLPFDSNNVPELRKRVLIGQYRLPFFISSDCSSLISHMLTVDPEQRYTINDIKNHPWLMLNNTDVSHLTSQTQSIPNCQLTNAILDHAESLGYNRTQILKSVNGNSYDSDAAIWHLLLEKFQQTCQIDSKTHKKQNIIILYLISFLDSHIPVEPIFNDDLNNSDLKRRSTAPIIFGDNNSELVYSAPNIVKTNTKKNLLF